MKTLYFLVGPTASGKSAAALSVAGTLGAEIISLDSALVYRGMDIGTAKPSAAEQALVPHHLIDTIDPTEQWSIAQYASALIAAVASVESRGKRPLVVGGTMMYAHAFVHGLSPIPPANLAVRAQIEAEAKARGWPALHAELARTDPALSARLQPNDAQRISRALEVWRATGQTLSSWQGQRAPLLTTHQAKLIKLEPSDRSVLHARIAARFDGMLAQGFIDEVVALRQRYALTAEHASMRCVGYRHAWAFLDGTIDRAALREQGIQATRQLAKRQLTWLRALPGLSLDPLVPGLEAKLRAALETGQFDSAATLL